MSISNSEHVEQALSAPYPEPDGQGRTSGWSGSDTSHERAVTEDADGTTHKRQREVLVLLGTSHNPNGSFRGQAMGLTVAEIRDKTGWHHGQASSALSVLHKEGKIARLQQRRGRCAIYVLPEYVNGRATAPHGRSKRPVGLSHAEKVLVGRLRANEGTAVILPSEKQTLLGLIERLTDG